MQELKNGTFGEPFPVETSIKNQSELGKKLAEVMRDPNTKAIHFGTQEELEKMRKGKEAINMEEFNRQYKLPLKERHGMFHDARSNHVMDIDDEKIRKVIHALINTGIEIEDNDFSCIKYPVYYKPTKIYDADNNIIVNIRGWGRISKMEKGEDIQDRIGNEIAELINKACPKSQWAK